MADPYSPPGSAPARPPVPGEHPGRATGPPAPAPPRRPVEPDPRAARRTAQLVGRFTLLVTAGLVATTLHLPWRAGALVFLLAALVTGVLALVWAVRAGARPGAVVSVVLGLVATFLVVLLQAAWLVLALSPATSGVERCQDEALTRTAREACTAGRPASVPDLFAPTRLTTSGRRAPA